MYPDIIDSTSGAVTVNPKYTELMSRISYKGFGESEVIKLGRPEGDDTPSDRRTDINFDFIQMK